MAWRDWLPLAGALLPWTAAPALPPTALEPLGGNRHVSRERARRGLGYQPRPLRETVRDTLAWFEAAGDSSPGRGEDLIPLPVGRGTGSKKA